MSVPSDIRPLIGIAATRALTGSEAEAASSRRSSSPVTTDSKWLMTSRGRRRRVAGDSRSIMLAAK